MTDPSPTVGELINLLFEVIRRPDGKIYTEREVSEQVNITHKTLNHIRSGKTPNPGINSIREICRFFGVSIAYFDCPTRDACYAFLRDRKFPEPPAPAANEIMFRALELSEAARQDMLKVLGWIEAAEQKQQSV